VKTWSGLLVWMPLLLACVVGTGDEPGAEPRPAPEQTPAEVVRIQLGALARNDEPELDAGIAVAFRFASPDNKRATGPLPNFIEIVRGEAYAPLLGHIDAEITDVSTLAPHAAVSVRVVPREGPELSYVFLLTQQASGRYERCWMTDAVYRADADEPRRVAL
jgi:hypothetical protein